MAVEGAASYATQTTRHMGPTAVVWAFTVPELEHSKTVVLDTFASTHSRRNYKHATASEDSSLGPTVGFPHPVKEQCQLARAATAGGRDVGVHEPLLHFGDVRLV